jgi:hypothetical protein
VKEFHHTKNLEDDISSSGKSLEEVSSSGVKSLVWIHQMDIALLNLD